MSSYSRSTFTGTPVRWDNVPMVIMSSAASPAGAGHGLSAPRMAPASCSRNQGYAACRAGVIDAVLQAAAEGRGMTLVLADLRARPRQRRGTSASREATCPDADA